MRMSLFQMLISDRIWPPRLGLSKARIEELSLQLVQIVEREQLYKIDRTTRLKVRMFSIQLRISEQIHSSNDDPAYSVKSKGSQKSLTK